MRAISGRARAAGFSLIEVVLALGLLAMVLISISGLFILGARQVRSGRSSSEALSVARAILEDMEGWGFRQVYERFGLAGAEVSYQVDSRANAYAVPWQDELTSMIPGSYATIDLLSLGSPGGPAPVLGRTQAIRILVTIHWNEGSRGRQLQLGTVRL
jgi:type II secretory pathway pseudopilin PulG